MLLGRFAPRPGFICAKDLLLLSQAQPAQRRTPGANSLSSILLWKIASAHRVDGHLLVPPISYDRDKFERAIGFAVVDCELGMEALAVSDCVAEPLEFLLAVVTVIGEIDSELHHGCVGSLSAPSLAWLPRARLALRSSGRSCRRRSWRRKRPHPQAGGRVRMEPK